MAVYPSTGSNFSDYTNQELGLFGLLFGERLALIAILTGVLTCPVG